MSGFFAQVLARAQGDAGPLRVRPQAAVAWAGGGEGPAEADDGVVTLAAPQAAPPPLRGVDGGLEAGAPIAAVVAGRARAPAQRPPLWPHLSPQPQPALEGVPDHGPESATDRPPRKLQTPNSQADAQTRLAPPAPAATHSALARAAAMPQASEQPATAPRTPPQPLQAETAPPLHAAPPHAQAAASAVQAFIAPAVQRPGAASAARRGPAAAAPHHDTTVVHVSIGRVELIAQPAAPAPRARATAPRSGSVPLADYLRGKPR